MNSSRTKLVVIAASLVGPVAALAIAERSLSVCFGGCSAEDASTGYLLLGVAAACLLLAPVIAGLVLRSVRAAAAAFLGEVVVIALGAFSVYLATL